MVAGKIYYRSDTRPPEQIFKEGFTPKLNQFQELWWKEAIKSRGYINDYGLDNQAIDADPVVCICMTTKLESAPIFPLNTEDSYIYAIALPEPTQVEYLGQGNGAVRLSKTANTPTDALDTVIDLHSFQTVQARNVCGFFDHKVDNLGAYAGWPLYAYEAIAFKVPPQSIICAIKCTRENSGLNINVSCDIADKPKCSEDKKFMLVGDIIENSSFSRAHILSMGEAMQSRWVGLNYGPLKEQALQEINRVKEQKETYTPDIYYGLGGKTF
ncbi:hypothetical protein [Legionella fallonii]|uniref:Uncharacterized protein n=1 Tax=Legionella fallonii LLAP-10 TaxID=1212491 RepID=A0A098G4Z6_9GAMM|nr:hypothetical protein [Legionella fallonii]CEG56565.1 conserved protein of unknown function [Legionella fallonii LLAP-10]